MYENPHEQKIAEAMGYADKGKPFVSFFDNAVPNAQLTEESGRPRFVEKVYIQKIPSAPDLIKRDIFTRAANEDDKREFPAEWEQYLERKRAIDTMKPPVSAIPGMTAAVLEELKALNIRNCEDFANHKDPLDGLEELRGIARRIMEVSNEVKAVREKGQTVRDAGDRQVHRPAGVSWGRAETQAQKGNEKESFTYTFSA